MPSDTHVYDLYDNEGKKRLGVVTPSRKERLADHIYFQGSFYRANRREDGGIINYWRVSYHIEGKPADTLPIATPTGILYGC